MNKHLISFTGKIIFITVMSYILFSASLTIEASTESPHGFEYGRVLSPDGLEWQSPELLALNKEAPHAYFFPFSSVENALKVLPEHSRYYLSLDGSWKFNWVPSPDKRPVDFFHTDYDVSGWDDIIVPGNWCVQGIGKDGSLRYGVPIYVNQKVIFYHKYEVDDWRKGIMREAPEDWTIHDYPNEVGSYRRSFSVPGDWKGREVYINFDGVDSFFYLWINGHYVGFSKNSRNTASFNITPYLNMKEENTVAVEVYRISDGSFLESQDMFRLPGIFRSTYLTSTPKVHIQDLQVLADMNGHVSVAASVRNLSDNDANDYKLSYSVYPVELYSDHTGKILASPTESRLFSVSKNGASEKIRSEFSVDDPNLWSAELPYRYVVVAELSDKKGETVEIVSTYFGFRSVELRDTPAEDDEFGQKGRYFYVNGKPVKLKGVNRHEHNPATGHSVCHEQMEQEALLMKAANINHVRNCHYNDDPYWYIVADKYGLYLEDEANIESHQYYYGEASLSHPKEWRDAHVARNVEMVKAHFNHPSIVIWSLGNEAGPGQNFVEAYNAIKEIDISRPVQYERNNDIVDIGSNQYPSISWVRKAATGESDVKYPFHISEYAHSMGNAGGNLKDYWDAIESTNHIMGGAIWDWVDQALYHYTPDGTRYLAYGGDFGDKPNDGMFCMNGIMFADLSPKPEYAEVKRVYQNVSVTPIDEAHGEFEVFNKYYFTSLDDDYCISWQLLKDGAVVEESNEVPRPNIKIGPRESQKIIIPYDFSSLSPESEYFLNIRFLLNHDKPWGEKGYPQMETQLLVKEPLASDNYRFAYSPSDKTNHKKIKIDNNQPGLTKIKGDDFEVVFNDDEGTISILSYGNDSVIVNGSSLHPDTFRAPVDNDVVYYQDWFENGLHNLQHKAVSRRLNKNSDGSVEIRYVIESQAPMSTTAENATSGHYRLSPGKEMKEDDFKLTTEVAYTIHMDGSIRVDSDFSSNKPEARLPRIGFALTIPEEFSYLTYYGRGPGNNFRDRRAGSDLGLYTSTVAEQFVPFPKPQSMGGREEVRHAALTNSEGKGIKFIALNPKSEQEVPVPTFSFSALPWSDIEMTLAPHPKDLPISSGTHVHIDSRTLGLGGLSCGQGGPLDEDQLFATPHTLSFLICRP